MYKPIINLIYFTNTLQINLDPDKVMIVVLLLTLRYQMKQFTHFTRNIPTMQGPEVQKSKFKFVAFTTVFSRTLSYTG